MKEAQNHYKTAGGARDAAQTLMDLGQIDLLMELPDRARVTFAQARTMYRGLNEMGLEGAALRAIGDLESQLGRLPQAQQAYAEARGLFQQSGDHISEADSLLMIGLLSINVDNATAAAFTIQAGRLYKAVGTIEWYRRAFALARRIR